MDFRWRPEQDALYDRLRVAAASLAPGPPDQAGNYATFSRDQWRRCGDLGFLGLSVPTPYGGQGFDALTTARCVEAFGRGCEDLGLVFSVAAHLFACVMPVVMHGPEELKRRALPRLCSGEWIAGNGMTEAQAGSDSSALKTRAQPDPAGYRLTGTKTYVCNAALADVFVVYATVDPSLGWMGVTAFLVEADRPGIEVLPPFPKMGLSSSPSAEVRFHECLIPPGQRLGPEGQGARVFQDSMTWERACLFALYLGMMDRQLDRCLDHVRTRRQFGKPLGKLQAVAHKLADMKLRLEAARLLLYQACWALDQGEASPLFVALSKLAVSEAAVRSSLDAVQLFGGQGYRSDAGIEAFVRDALPATIFSGTSEIQRDLIAKELGL